DRRSRPGPHGRRHGSRTHQGRRRQERRLQVRHQVTGRNLSRGSSMLNLNYVTLAAAYRRYAAVAPAALREALGWSAYSSTPAYARNGAVLTSLALLSAGVPLSGPLRIEAGPLAGRKVQNGANRLAD